MPCRRDPRRVDDPTVPVDAVDVIASNARDGRAVRIDDIRADEAEVGLRDFEASFLRLIEKVVNGCEIVINETGTALRYRPGIIVGGERLTHDCGTSRAIGYFVEPLHLTINYALSLGYTRVVMMGKSGGGWTTTVCSALDPRIDVSFPIAGSIPLSFHHVRWIGSCCPSACVLGL